MQLVTQFRAAIGPEAAEWRLSGTVRDHGRVNLMVLFAGRTIHVERIRTAVEMQRFIDCPALTPPGGGRLRRKYTSTNRIRLTLTAPGFGTRPGAALLTSRGFCRVYGRSEAHVQALLGHVRLILSRQVSNGEKYISENLEI